MKTTSHFVFTRRKSLCLSAIKLRHSHMTSPSPLSFLPQTELEKFPSNSACKDAAVSRRVSVIGMMKLNVWQLLLFSDMLATTFVKTRKHFPTHLWGIYSGITRRRAKSLQPVLNTDLIFKPLNQKPTDSKTWVATAAQKC